MLVAVLISAALSVYTWRHRVAPGATAFAWLMLAVAELSLSYAATLVNHNPSTKILLAKIQFVGYVCLPMAWLAFAVEYTGRDEWLTRHRLALIALIPFVTLLLAWTNGAHGLIWKRITFYQDGGLMLMQIKFGLWFWIHTLCSYLYLISGTVLLMASLARSLHLYRQQAVALLVAVLLPWVGNVMYVFGLGPLRNLDLTPLAFSLTGLSIAWGLFRYRLFDLIPVARNKLVDIMGDGMIVLDVRNRILDMNPAIQSAMGILAKQAVGQPADRLFSSWPEMVDRFLNADQTRGEFNLNRDKATTTYDVRVTPLSDRKDRPVGRLILLRDITDKKLQEQNQEKLIVELREALAQVKQLKELLPICASCKKIRNDEGYWQEVEVYINKHVDVQFSHGICPDCAKRLYPHLKHPGLPQT
jgi:PAS domain S-box-containing protein